MSTKSKNAVVIVVASIAAYALGSVIGFPQVANDLSKGDIAKVNRYSRSVVSPALSLVQEKLQADESYRKQTLDMFTVISARLSGFQGLCELSTQATEGLSEFDAINARLQTNIPTAQNAALRGEEMLQALNDLVEGKKVENFEQLSNNIVISYLIIDKEVSLGKSFVELADAHLNKENNDKLAFVRDMWMDYCAVDAYLNGDQSEVDYWSEKDYFLTPDQMSASYQVEDQFSKLVQNASIISVGYLTETQVQHSQQMQVQHSQQMQVQHSQQMQVQDHQFETNLSTLMVGNQFQSLSVSLKQFTENFSMGEQGNNPIVGGQR